MLVFEFKEKTNTYLNAFMLIYFIKESEWKMKINYVAGMHFMDNASKIYI